MLNPLSELSEFACSPQTPITLVNADVLQINEFDFDLAGTSTANSEATPLGYSSNAAKLFQDNFLSIGHGGASTGRSASAALSYAYRYTPNTNTVLASGFDFDITVRIDGQNPRLLTQGFVAIIVAVQRGRAIQPRHKVARVLEPSRELQRRRGAVPARQLPALPSVMPSVMPLRDAIA